jgi:hypothetical protein
LSGKSRLGGKNVTLAADEAGAQCGRLSVAQAESHVLASCGWPPEDG